MATMMRQLLMRALPPLREWADNDPLTNWLLLATSIGLTLFAGMASGLTLGLMSLDPLDLEVLVRSGTPQERGYAEAIMPVIKNGHFLLVTLLLCNALSMEALPIFLDRLVDPVTAILVSVTAVLVFGEIVPQAVCSRLVDGGRAVAAREGVGVCRCGRGHVDPLWPSCRAA